MDGRGARDPFADADAAVDAAPGEAIPGSGDDTAPAGAVPKSAAPAGAVPESAAPAGAVPESAAPAGADATTRSGPGGYCPFLAAIDLDDRIRVASPVPDTANRCLSTGEPVAPVARDQAALCLSGAHASCPRYVRATRRVREPAAPPPSRGPRISTPVAAAFGVLMLAALLAGVSLAANGDMSVGLGTSASAAPSASADAGPAASPAGLAAAATPSLVVPTAAPVSPTPAPPATPTPVPTFGPTPTPKAYKGLTPCPGAADCYIYVVKRGDALAAVAARYGLTLDEVLARNPKIRDPGLIVLGQKIRMPTPRK